MIEMKGTEKQVAWAEDIRSVMLDRLGAEKERIEGEKVEARPDRKIGSITIKGVTLEQAEAEHRAKLDRVVYEIAQLLCFDDAVWFIENRRFASDGWGIVSLEKAIRSHTEYIVSKRA